jgi:hypothetical protein
MELFQPAEPPSSGKRSGRGGRRGGGGGGGGSGGGSGSGGGRRGRRQPPTFTMTGEGGIPGQICCECKTTDTPQWREGPSGESSWACLGGKGGCQEVGWPRQVSGRLAPPPRARATLT